MMYRFRDMVVAMFGGIIIGVLIVGAVIVDARGANGRANSAEAIAQCIAEFDYTHPRRNRFDNLVGAIRWCNIGDRATAHQCVAPCRVILSKGTLEDEFGINYGWMNHRPIVDVWVKGGR